VQRREMRQQIEAGYALLAEWEAKIEIRRISESIKGGSPEC
jgi:hypothetical protein